jgi:hypothetical protein
VGTRGKGGSITCMGAKLPEGFRKINPGRKVIFITESQWVKRSYYVKF